MAHYNIDTKISVTPNMWYGGRSHNIGWNQAVGGGKRVICSKRDRPESVKYYTYTTTDTAQAIPKFVDREDIHTLFIKIISSLNDAATKPNLFIGMHWPIIAPGDELVQGSKTYYTDQLTVTNEGEIVAPSTYYNSSEGVTGAFYNNENFYLEDVNDCTLLRTSGLSGRDIFFRSTDITGLCNIEIMVGSGV